MKNTINAQTTYFIELICYIFFFGTLEQEEQRTLKRRNKKRKKQRTKPTSTKICIVRTSFLTIVQS